MRIKHFCLAATVLTFALLILGAVVHNTESSLACPDWPLCYGQVFPRMEGGILIEHSHRLLASLIGLLNIILVFLAYRYYKRDERYLGAYRQSLMALAFVIIQGILGGITVKYTLPTIVSTTHLTMAMIYFCVLIALYHRLDDLEGQEIEVSESAQPLWDPLLQNAVLASAIVVFLQMILGAFMRHAGAGTACGLGWDNAFLCHDTTSWIRSIWPSSPQAELHMVHRLFALVAATFVFFAGFRSFTLAKKVDARIARKLKICGALSIALVVIQITLGILTVAWNISVVPTTLHLAFAALLLASLWYQNLWMQSLEQKIYPAGKHTWPSDLIDLTKPKLAGLVMMTVLVGVILAPAEINFFRALFAFILVGMVVMGAAALNCYIERDVDSLMERTRTRPLPAGRMRGSFALIFAIGLLLISIPALAIFVNLVTAALAALAAILYLFAYTPMKRKSVLAVYVGAIPGAIPPVLGWTAVTGTLDPMAWALFAILFIWQIPHFFAIAIFHARDYRAADIKIYPNQSGLPRTKALIVLFTIVLFASALLPVKVGAGRAYELAAIVLSGAFLALSFAGYFAGQNEEPNRIWAKRYFYGSIFYLPLLLGAMMFLK
jgi:protoheme IX farnesyltransferase